MKNAVWIFGVLLSMSSFARDARQEASYRIPVEEAELEAHSHHKLRLKWKSLEPGKRVMNYDLPNELDGLGQEIELSETTPNQFYGPKGYAACEEGEAFMCQIRYHDLARDDAEAERILAERYVDADEFAGRSTISSAFRAEPEPQGVLTTVGEVDDGDGDGDKNY
jgi:hypothetical protein